MENLIIEIMNNFGYIGVCLLIMIENVFPPIPSELILTFGGFMTISTKMSVVGVIILLKFVFKDIDLGEESEEGGEQ